RRQRLGRRTEPALLRRLGHRLQISGAEEEHVDVDAHEDQEHQEQLQGSLRAGAGRGASLAAHLSTAITRRSGGQNSGGGEIRGSSTRTCAGTRTSTSTCTCDG